MDLNRNASFDLISNICQVEIQSAYHNTVIPEFQQVYGSPSSISFRSISRLSDAGIKYENSISLLYPGLGIDDFQNFEELVIDSYYVRLHSTNDLTYDIATIDSEMILRTSFDQDKGFTLNFRGNSTKAPQQVLQLGNAIGFQYTLGFTL